MAETVSSHAMFVDRTVRTGPCAARRDGTGVVTLVGGAVIHHGVGSFHPRFLAPSSGCWRLMGGVTGGGRCARPPATLCDPDRGRSWPGRTGCGRTGCGWTGCGWTGRRRLCRGRTVFALGQWDRNRSTPTGSTCPGSSRVCAFRATTNSWPVGPTNRVVWTRFPARWAGLGEGLARWAGRRFPVWGARGGGRVVRERRKTGWLRMMAGGSQPFQG